MVKRACYTVYKGAFFVDDNRGVHSIAFCSGVYLSSVPSFSTAIYGKLAVCITLWKNRHLLMYKLWLYL